MFSIDSKAAWLIGEGRYHTQLQGRCVSYVYVCLLSRGVVSVTMWEENNTINHCSWNISFLKDHEPYWWSELECIFTPAILFIALVMAGGWSGLLIFTHLDVVLIVVIKNWTIEPANGAWRFSLRAEEHKQAIIYESEQANAL